jgi:DHA2 family lincomycin resistance protein-like MFS transporter
MSSAPEAVTQAKPRLPGHVSRILFILLGANFVVSLNETVLGVALPVLMRDLHITASVGQWLTTAFLLTMAAVIPVTGYLQSRFSARHLFLAAMATFIVGTLLGALSVSFEILLIGRVLQAAGTALLMPLFMTTMMKIVPETMRGMVMGQVSLVFAVAPALGPAASGLIVQAWGWHALFWVVLPFALVATVIGARSLNLDHEPGPMSLDLLSLGLSAVGFSALIYGLSEVGSAVRGQAQLNPVYPIGAGVVLVVWFVSRQLKLAPKNLGLLDLATFKSPAFRNSIILMTLMMISLFGVIIIVPIYVQGVLHQTALATGLLMMPGGLLQGLLGGVAGKLFDKRGARRILVPAMTGVAISVGLMASFGTATPMWLVFIAYSLLNASLAFVFPVLFGVAMASLQQHLYSHGSATMGVVQQVAGAAGTAGFIAVLTMLSGGGTATTSAYALNAGTHGAFLLGTVISVIAAVFAFRVRHDKPVEGGVS